MSKTQVITYSPKFTSTEIAAAVRATALPASLQGVESWNGSKEIGGNVASHLASANGKGQTIGICSLFGDWYFGSESRDNILKGLAKKEIRQAFEVATREVIRPRQARSLDSVTMLDFLRDFVRSGMEQMRVKSINESEPVAPMASEPVAPMASEPVAPMASEPVAPMASEPVAPMASEPVALMASEPVALDTLLAMASELAEAQAKLAAAQAKLAEISKATSIKAVKAILTA